MTSYERLSSLPEYQDNLSDVNYSKLAKAPGIPEGVIRDSLDDFQGTKQELCEYAAALQARNTELEAYAHMVAHDLKDPLAVMVMTSDMMTHVPDLTREELKEYLQQIKSTAHVMNRIIDNLLLFAEVRMAQAPVGAVHMARVVANVQDRLSYIIKERQAQIDVPEVWPNAIGYGPWIEEVWANYLSNALKYGGQPPRLELGAAAQPDGMLRFWARDNGPGIPPQSQERLFTSLSHTGLIPKKGHGLGLSIVLHIVEKLGGQVGVESELGKGSLFFFTLPAGPSSS